MSGASGLAWAAFSSVGDASVVGDASMPGDVDVVEELGESHFLYVRSPDGSVLTVRAGGDAPVRAKSRINLGIPGEACHVFNKDGMALPRLQ